MNLMKASDTLDKIKSNTQHYLSIIGKIIKINTYIYTTLYNNAWIINTKSKAFKTFVKKISIYLQRIKNEDVYRHVARGKEFGGLGLVDIEERLNTIKTRELLEIEDECCENDDLLYEIGLKQKIITGKEPKGPKAETARPDIQTLITGIEKYKTPIEEYKKTHKKLKTKDLQTIIYPKERQQPPNTYFSLMNQRRNQ